MLMDVISLFIETVYGRKNINESMNEFEVYWKNLQWKTPAEKIAAKSLLSRWEAFKRELKHYLMQQHS